MKKQALSVIVVLSFVIAVAVTGLANLNGRITVNVPFDFNVGNQQLPSGKYYVSGRNQARDAASLVNADTGQSVSFIVQTGRAPENAKQAQLVFHRYGQQSFLANIWDGQSPSTAELIQSKAEREAARSAGKYLAGGTAQPEVIAIAAQ